MPIFCSHLLVLPSSMVLSSGLARLFPFLKVYESNLSTTIIMFLWFGFIIFLNLEFCYTKYLVATYWLVISKESYNCWLNHQQSEKIQLILKKTEHRRIDAFELWCWRLLRVPWTARRSTQSTLKEITPEYSLEGLMLKLKLKLQYFGHLMQRADSLEKTLIMGKIEGRKSRGWQRWDSWMASLTWWTWVWASPRSWWWTGKPGVLQSIELQRVRHNWVTELNWILKSREILESASIIVMTKD